MVLAAVAITRPQDIHWLYHEAGRFFPEEWQRFRAGVSAAERDGDLVAAYSTSSQTSQCANRPHATGAHIMDATNRFARA